jgi:hypothetical protein
MSNLIALQNSSNTLGLGTSHIGLGTTGSSVLPFKKNDGTILMNFNTSNNSINLGTIGSGVWQGSVIEPAYGGLGVTTLGLASQVLNVNSLGNYNWINNEIDLTTTSEISRNVTSTIGIGSISHDLTINTSKLTINIGNNTPQEGQILKYNNDGLIWSDSNSNSIDKFWTLIKTFHPGYVLFLKSIQVSGTNTIDAISPSFDPIITDYSINVNDNLTVSITPNKFNIPSNTSEATTLINNSVIQNSYIILDSIPSSNTFTIKNLYTENSETFDKIYTLNIERNKLTDNNLDSLTITEQNSNNITLNETLGVGTVYTIDVNTNVKNIKMVSNINRTVQRLGIGTVSSGTDTQLNISKNNDSIIGIGTGFVGIGTTDVFDTNIESGRISDVFLNIKAENNSDKQYTFKISSPPRDNTELEQIIITKIKTDDTPEPLSPIRNSLAITEIDITNLYKEIKFEIKKKHLDQTINIEKDSTNINSVDVNIDSSVGHTLITELSTFSNYIEPQNSDNIVDNFKITNTPLLGDSITYQIKCKKIRSTNTVPKSIKITSGSNTLINLNNSDLSTLNHSLFDQNILASNSVTIEVIKDGGQKITLLSNTSGINELTPIIFNTNSKTISINSNQELYNFLLEVEAETAETKQTYNISITADLPPTVQTNGITVTSGTGTYIYSSTNNNDNIITIKIDFTENVNANSNTYLNLSNNDVAYIDTTSTYINTDNLIFKYTINNSSSNSYNLQINSFGPDNSIVDLTGNNCSSISGSLGGINIGILSSFGLNNDKNKQYKIKSSYGGDLADGSDIFITVFQRTTTYAYHWSTSSSHLNYGDHNYPWTSFVVTSDPQMYDSLGGTNIFKLDNISVDSSLFLIADIIAADNSQAYVRNNIGAGVISFATHMDSRYHNNNHNDTRPYGYNQNNYNNTSLDSQGNKRVKIAQIGSDYIIQNIGTTTSAGSKYLELNNLWGTGDGTSKSIDPALWGNGTGTGTSLTNYRFWKFIEV